MPRAVGMMSSGPSTHQSGPHPRPVSIASTRDFAGANGTVYVTPMNMEIARWMSHPTITDSAPTMAAIIGIMPMNCIMMPKTRPPASPAVMPGMPLSSSVVGVDSVPVLGAVVVMIPPRIVTTVRIPHRVGL